MRVIAKSTLRAFWQKHPKAETPLKTWHAIVSKANWTGPADVKKVFGASVDLVGDSRVIFDIGGNKFRIVAHCAHPYRRVLIKFVGTHEEHDKINAETI